ncbi:MAG: hypothetical protein H6719_08405 [Sandaracinaceae bacterium]|nr:hypothetical protein [Sandaracinaceae bacterium]
MTELGGRVEVVAQTTGAERDMVLVGDDVIDDAGFVQIAVANVDDDVDDELIIASFGTSDEPGRTRIWIADGPAMTPTLNIDLDSGESSSILPPHLPRLAATQSADGRQSVVVALQEHPWDPALAARQAVFLVVPSAATAAPCRQADCVEWFAYECADDACSEGFGVDLIAGAGGEREELTLGILQRNVRLHDASVLQAGLLECGTSSHSCARIAHMLVQVDPTSYRGSVFTQVSGSPEMTLLSGSSLQSLTLTASLVRTIPIEQAILLATGDVGGEARFLLTLQSSAGDECQRSATVLHLSFDGASGLISESQTAAPPRLVPLISNPDSMQRVLCSSPSGGPLRCYGVEL